MMDERIVHISTWEIVKLHFLSFVFGLYLIVIRFLKWAWDPKKFFILQQRDKPPPCLVDSNLGTHSYVKIKGVKFHYVESGDKQKSLVLLLHGFPDCWLSWREQIPLLSKHYRVIAVDLKGFGDSDKPSNRRSYKVELLIEELRQFILSFGANTCTIIGHDLGGLLGWYLVTLHGDMVHKFIAIASPHPNIYWNESSSDAIFDGKWMHFSRLPFLPEIDALKEDLSIINESFPHLQVNSFNNGKTYVEAYKYTFSRKEDWTGPINYFRNLPFTRLNTESCEQINCRTLFLVGNMDPSVTIESIVRSTEYVEKFNVKVIARAHHFPHQEMPQAVNKAIMKFLIGTPTAVETTPPKSIVSSWLGSISSTVKYGNQMFDAVHKRTNDVVHGLPGKVFHLGQTTS